jgi:hypothetical protein
MNPTRRRFRQRCLRVASLWLSASQLTAWQDRKCVVALLTYRQLFLLYNQLGRTVMTISGLSCTYMYAGGSRALFPVVLAYPRRIASSGP